MNPADTNHDDDERTWLIAIFKQNCENARHIKNERLSFTSIYAIVAAGILSLFHSVTGEKLLEISLIIFLCFFSLIGLITAFRLKAELEECMSTIEQIVSRIGLTEFMALGGQQGALRRYPKFRWVLPIFFAVNSAGFLGLLIHRLFFAF